MRNYITKINDRNLQRRKATGITNYVLYSVLTLIVFKILDILSEIEFDTNSLDFLKILMYSFNFSLAIYMIYYSFLLSVGNSSSLRVLKKNNLTESYYNTIIFILILIVPIIPVLYVSFYYYTNEVKLTNYLWCMLTLSFLNILFAFLGLFTKDKSKYSVYKGTDKQKNLTLSYTILIISSLVIFFSIKSIYYLDSDLDKLNIFILGTLTVSVLFILEKIIEGYSNDIFTKDLENLEYEVYVKDFSDDEIRVILQNNYMGFLINEWIIHKEEELVKELENFASQKSIIIDAEENLKKIDKKTYPIEYKGRLDEVNNLDSDFKRKIKSVFEDNIKEVEEIINKDQSISQLESSRLFKLKKILEANYELQK